MGIDVIAGSSSPILGKRIAEKLAEKLNVKTKLVPTTVKRFPDGELYVMVESTSSTAVVVQSLNKNDDLIELILTLDALEGKNVIVVIPYMGYARQDRAFKEGEAISIRAVAKMIENYTDEIVTVNIHSKKAKGYFKRLTDVDAMPLIGEYYKGRDVVMISPDFGSYERVKTASEYAGCDFDYLEKVRIDAERVEIKPKSIDLKGREVVIVDDIISTGGTIVEAMRVLKDCGVKSVECACVHAVLVGNALNRLYSAGVKEVVATDTVEKGVSVISVADLLVDVIERIIVV